MYSNSQCYLAKEVQYTGRMEYFLNVTLERADGWHQDSVLGLSIMYGMTYQQTRPMLQIYAVLQGLSVHNYADMAGLAMYKFTETRSMLDL